MTLINKHVAPQFRCLARKFSKQSCHLYPLTKSSLPIFTVHCSCRLVTVRPKLGRNQNVNQARKRTFIYLCFARQISFQIDGMEINVNSCMRLTADSIDLRFSLAVTKIVVYYRIYLSSQFPFSSQLQRNAFFHTQLILSDAI